jgi:quercetin dioxygenase-like cupin family protein
MSDAVALWPNRVAILARGDDTDGTYSIVEWVMAPPPALGPPLHRHDGEDEAVILLAGQLEATVEDQARHLGAAEFRFVRRRTWHTVSNPGPRPARFLVVLSPPGFERFSEAMAATLVDNPRPNPAALLDLQRGYGMEAAGAVRRFG